MLPLVALAAALPASADPLVESTQLVLVSTVDWDDVDADLETWERASPGAGWRRGPIAAPAVVGRHGLGWGAGLHALADEHGGPIKREGDGRAPAGAFALSGAFGYAPAATGLSYALVTDAYCVDDAASPLYNRLVFDGPHTWASAEEMGRTDGLYRLGLLVDHNAAPAWPGGGSCIFVHLWRGRGLGTAGCTAAAPAKIAALLGWLRADARPVLVQLPLQELARLRQAWGLP